VQPQGFLQAFSEAGVLGYGRDQMERQFLLGAGKNWMYLLEFDEIEAITLREFDASSFF